MQRKNLILEIGCEELPSSAIRSAVAQLEKIAPIAFVEANLTFDEIRTAATPRRLILNVLGLASATEPRTQTFKGPAAAAAYDAAGEPTKALLGFARSKGVDIDDLEVVEADGSSYVWATVHEEAVEADSLLPQILLRIVSSLEFKKSQKWGSGSIRFARPIRWLLALFGARVVTFEFAGLTSGRLSRGHRLLAADPFSVASAEGLIPSLENVYVRARTADREHMIREGIATAEARFNATAIVPQHTFDEVVDLVEHPTVAAGEFDEEFLRVPPEIVIEALVEHQRYFPLRGADGKLTNRFILVHNGDPDRTATIVAGHERVVRARLADAAFFYDEDLSQSLDRYVPRLAEVTFHESLGTVADKVNRILGLVGDLSELAGVSDEVRDTALRAAFLAKADLVTSAVVEFTSLQGVMGGYYALESGEEPEVADAIVEHYRPRYAGDDIPTTDAGRLVALADKLDTIAGIFSVGQGPTGSSDPFALRRSALGVLAIVVSGVPLDLRTAIVDAVREYSDLEGHDTDAVTASILEFFRGRLSVLLRDRGFAYDTVDAVMSVHGVDPVGALAFATAIDDARREDPALYEDLATAYARANNLRDASLGTDVDTANLVAAEQALYDAIEMASAALGAVLEGKDVHRVLELLATLRAPIDRFFDDVRVMDPDPAVKENRLRLLNRFVAVFAPVADLSKMAG